MSFNRPTLSWGSKDLNVSQAVRFKGTRGVDLRCFGDRPSMIASRGSEGGVLEERLLPIINFSKSLED
jgi:hypothetical protein